MGDLTVSHGEITFTPVDAGPDQVNLSVSGEVTLAYTALKSWSTLFPGTNPGGYVWLYLSDSNNTHDNTIILCYNWASIADILDVNPGDSITIPFSVRTSLPYATMYSETLAVSDIAPGSKTLDPHPELNASLKLPQTYAAPRNAIAALPCDLSVSDLTSSAATVTTGAYYTASFYVSNTGPRDAAPAFEYYLGKDPTFDATATKIDPLWFVLSTISNVAASSSVKETADFALPTTVAPGNYYLFAYVDPTHSENDSNYGNNVVGTPITVTQLEAAPVPLAQPYGLNGDGLSEIIFRNPTTGDLGWYEAGAPGVSPTWTEFGATSPSYSIVGIGDYNGDGIADILFRNSSGNLGFIADHAGTKGTWVGLGATNPQYAVLGTSDFNGDGTSDILFRNVVTGDAGVYLLNTSGPGTWQGLGPTSLLYSVVGTGDFLGNGKAQILFENTSTGSAGLYQPGTGRTPGIWTGLWTFNTSYAVVGAGDFAGIGSSDILFRNTTTGDLGYVWLEHDSIPNWSHIGQTSLAYDVAGAGYYSPFAMQSDILFRNPTTGDTGYIDLTALSPTPVWFGIGPTSTAYDIIASPTYG